ncbi:hypothetical protein KGQ20_07990 [Catenulispora sp. NF23]|uniref:condensation domain-containing protein n=1 Tax=Catenulispora pinistramenti TaxID=2705254 RepID=UPI001BA992D3|nr:condensation domain-containing protein [Catenulispora pinistramenti]MBS2532712.1 hypothetical protein [Catenulispora pinistramenti]
MELSAPPRVYTVDFTGGRSGTGPATHAQRNLLRWIDQPDDAGSATIPLFLDLPAGTGVADVAEVLAALLARHDALRTTFAAGADGTVLQHVAATGRLEVEIHELPPGPPARGLERRLRRQPFDPALDLPLRAAVVTHGGQPHLAVLVISHLAADVGCARILADQFTALINGAEPWSAGPLGPSPLDDAAAEQSAAGRRRAEAALRYWDGVLTAVPQAMFSIPVPNQAPQRRRRATMRSRAAALALARIAARTGCSHSTVTLAAVALCLARRTGNQSTGMTLLAGNRFGAAMHDYVGSLAQDAPFHVDPWAATFDEVVRRTGTAALRAYGCGRFDPAQMWQTIDTVGRERGTHFHRDCVYNDTSRFRGQAPPSEPTGSAADIGQALEQTRITMMPDEAYPAAFFLSVRAVWEELVLMLWADPRYLPRADVNDFLLAVERVLVTCAPHDVPVPDLLAATGLAGPERGPGWIRSAGCWVDLACATEVFDAGLAALGSPGGALFAEPAGTGAGTQTGTGAAAQEVELVGYAAWPDRDTARPSPAELHEACRPHLAGRFSALTPQRYVVCAGLPADPRDPASWRAAGVLAEGSGRPERR